MRGFSLVELSIVLVILGLLTGGILAGQNLIRAAELRTVTTQYQSFVTATNTFQDKYFALPGDMRNAESFWGTMATGSCPTATGGTGTQTCNGNGDGNINDPTAANTAAEFYGFWQHLANAGLIEGSYTGRSDTGGSFHSSGGINVPRAKLSNAGWVAYYRPSTSTGAPWFNTGYGNMFFLGKFVTNSNAHDPIITPEEAWNIDTKMDDGKPGMGGVSTWTDTSCTDASSPTDFDADYLVNANSVNCMLVFPNSF